MRNSACRVQRGFGDGAERGHVHELVGTEPPGPARKTVADGGEDILAAFEFDAVTLAVVEADGLDARETIQRPRKAGRRILAA